MAAKKITVVIADDQTLFREGIKDLLEDEKGIEVIAEAADGQEALEKALAEQPDNLEFRTKAAALGAMVRRR